MMPAGESAFIAGPLLGQILAVLSAASFALSNNFVSLTRRSGGDRGVLFSVLVTMVMSGLLWAVLEAPARDWTAAREHWGAVGWFALSGVFAMVFGRSLVFESIRRLGVTRSTAVKRLDPFFSVALAAILLSEPIYGEDLAGMAAIAAAFGLLMRESLPGRRAFDTNSPPAPYYLFGVFSALAYALANVVRKVALVDLSMPAFGTFVSAVTGFACFGILALASERYRAHFRSLFSGLDRWVVSSAVMVSIGQILLFAAFSYESVSTVVMIVSMEIFISIFLSVLIFRSERIPGLPALSAAGLAMVGVVLVTA